MPGPDPFGIHVYEHEDGRFGVTAELWHHNKGGQSWGARKQRAQVIAQRLQWKTWRCDWCDGPIPTYKRLDARYCRERCRKAAARIRRKGRGVSC
jgi:hypothetical protein